MQEQWAIQGIESLEDYIKECGNPNWGASHLVRSIANALRKTNSKTSVILSEIANQLASEK